ncbi:hypothetical protein IPC1494_32785 [Pseudomonas aeruginosa]|uniref:adenylyltransferase/cytidyltransferase family protein n=1 Tax=Pseudomonas aeruginosa TaxID=287 RepID=UPI0010680132|nr:adenylyltransferase/cytidyltransferase family protein [Pseudomonas aeruginosa]TEE83062.1 hypothetical protein IPC1494_32785 [Pseudomonas aeruginosa]
MKLNYYSLSAIAHKTLKGDLGYTSGVFDLFHQGHKIYLEKCKTLCDTLIIGVDDDSLVKTRVSEFLCNRLMSDTVAPNRRHHEQDATSHH